MDIRQNIVIEIYKSGWLLLECRKVCFDKMLADDLMQEIILIILEYKPESILDTAYASGSYLGLIRRIIYNQYKSCTSPFWKKYRKNSRIESEYFDETTLIDE